VYRRTWRTQCQGIKAKVRQAVCQLCHSFRLSQLSLLRRDTGEQCIRLPGLRPQIGTAWLGKSTWNRAIWLTEQGLPSDCPMALLQQQPGTPASASINYAAAAAARDLTQNWEDTPAPSFYSASFVSGWWTLSGRKDPNLARWLRLLKHRLAEQEGKSLLSQTHSIQTVQLSLTRRNITFQVTPPSEPCPSYLWNKDSDYVGLLWQSDNDHYVPVDRWQLLGGSSCDSDTWWPIPMPGSTFSVTTCGWKAESKEARLLSLMVCLMYKWSFSVVTWTNDFLIYIPFILHAFMVFSYICSLYFTCFGVLPVCICLWGC
jgi:hypothetical protein